MKNLRWKKVLVFALIHLLILAQVFPSPATAGDTRSQVAFIGIKFENVPPDIRDTILWRMEAILEKQESFLLTKPEAARIAYGRDQFTALLEKQDAESFAGFANRFQFEHVFSGTLTNQSPDSNRVFLVGELNRFDLASGKINRYQINQEYDKFGNDLVEFRDQYVMAQDSRRKPWALLLAGGIVLATALTLRLTLSGGGGEEPIPDSIPGTDN